MLEYAIVVDNYVITNTILTVSLFCTEKYKPEFDNVLITGRINLLFKLYCLKPFNAQHALGKLGNESESYAYYQESAELEFSCGSCIIKTLSIKNI